MASLKGLPVVRNDDYKHNLFSVGDVVKYDPNLVCNVKKSSEAIKKGLEKVPVNRFTREINILNYFHNFVLVC